MSLSILDAFKRENPQRCLAPWKWDTHRINQPNRSPENGEPDNLQPPTPRHAQHEFQICYEAFERANNSRLSLQQCHHPSQALLPPIDVLEKQAITTDQFSGGCPRRLRFCGGGAPVPGDAVVGIGGVPVLGYNTSVCVHLKSQRSEDSDSNPSSEFSDATALAINMAIVIALAEGQAMAVEIECIETSR